MALAQIGATPKGGVRRLTLTELRPRGARALRAAGAGTPACELRVDAIGNIFARRAGQDAAAAPVGHAGSHLDTQPTGGKFDGDYGVMAGLEVVRTLNDAGDRDRRRRSRSRLDQRGGLALRAHHDGLGRLRRRLPARRRRWPTRTPTASACATRSKRIGYRGDGQRPHTVGAYFEAHIEQGPVLEDDAHHHRRGARRARPALVRRPRHRPGRARRPDADARCARTRCSPRRA